MKEIINELFNRIKGKSPEDLLRELDDNDIDKVIYLTYIGQKLLEMRDIVRKAMIDSIKEGEYLSKDGKLIVYTSERRIFNPSTVLSELEKIGKEELFKDVVDISNTKLKKVADELSVSLETFKPDIKEIKNFRIEIETEIKLKQDKKNKVKL